MEFRKGSQLVFEGAIAYTSSKEGKVGPADLVQVMVEEQKATGKKTKSKSYKHYSAEDAPTIPTQLIGWGVYNPSSLYRVRILCHANLQKSLAKTLKKEDVDAMETILHQNMAAAISTRRALNLPSDQTDTYRLINGEGDGLSGLAVDVLGGKVAVIMSSASWCQVYQETITSTLQELLPSHTIMWKTTPSRLAQDGWDVKANVPEVGEVSDEVVVTKESGISYNTFPFQDGQKTGVYCDQRDNKLQLTPLCEDKRVLDLCCYHGGFGLNAKLVGGAAHCTGVDSSQEAINIAEQNVALNGVEEGMEFVKDDVANFMRVASQEEFEWDVIVLDPPKLAPSVSGLDRASRKYHSLNRDALKLINSKEGGLLLTCTCSAAMTQKDGGQYFLQTVQQAAISAGRQVTLLRTSGAAPCHTQSPASYPAGAYLTAALFHVAPKDL